MRRICRDERARVPFAMVAVLILMLSVFSVAYVGGIQRREAGLRLVGAELSRQRTLLHQVEERMALEGFYIASRAVAASTRFLCDEAMLERCFSENYSAYLEENFPVVTDPYRIEVRGFTASIYLEERNLRDLVPSNATEEQNITLKDDSDGISEATVTALDTVTPEAFAETSALARYVVVGRGNCTVRNIRSGAAAERPISFERSIDSPFPLMNSKMLALESAGDNNAMGLSRIIKYVLTTLAQFRVLEGYGSGLDFAPGGTDEIITLDDVRLAVNLAVLLETARLFRGYDESVITELDALGLGAGGYTLGSLLGDYLNNGTLDPADIVALHAGLGDRELPVDIMLAQALNAIADQFILKYLDYFGVMDIANSIYRTGQHISKWIQDAGRALTQFISGDDGENRKGAEQVTDWVSTLCNDIQWPPEVTGIPGVRVGYGPMASTDLAVLDVMQPVAGVFHYSANCSRFVDGTPQPILDSDGMEIGESWYSTVQSSNVSAETSPGAYLADFRPTSMLRPELNDLWNDFYEHHYSARQDVIYDTIRDAVKNVTAEISSIITTFVGQRDLTLSGYAQGEFAIDPKDRISVLEGVRDLVEEVVAETTGYLISNPGAVSSLLATLTDRQAGLVLDFMEFVSQNYDVIVEKDSALDAAALTLAGSMLGNSTFSVQPVAEFSASYSLYNELGYARGFTDDPLPYNCAGTPDKDVYVRLTIEQNHAALRSDLDTPVETAYGELKGAEAAWDRFGSPDNGLFIKALEEKVGTMPDSILLRFVGLDSSALIGMGAGMVMGTLDGIIWGGGVSNTQYAPEIVYSDASGRIPFELYEGDFSKAADSGTVRTEYFSVVQQGGMLEAVAVPRGHDLSWLPAGTLAVNISSPSGVHYTDAATFSERPFENQWNISVKGTVRLSVSSGSLPYLGDGTHEPAVIDRDIILDLDIPVMAYSGWDLSGVEYASTATLAGDIGKLLDIARAFFGWVWDTIAGPLGWIIDQIMKVVDFFADIIGTLLGYASDVMNLITDIMGFLVEAVQDFLRDVAGWVLEKIVDWIIDLLPDGLEFSFSMFGFEFLVAFGSKAEIEDAKSGNGGRVISVGTSGDLFGAGMEIGLDLVVLSDEVAESVGTDYDLLLRSRVELMGFGMDTRMDPFMAVQEHIVECRGAGSGFGMELFIPVVECYDSITYSLHDIPGVGAALSNIPIPFLGLKASVNAGLEILYTLRGIEADHVVINEVEINPRGGTTGNQWVELYNPTESMVRLDKWTLGSSTHPDFNRTFDSSATIEPGGYFMVRYFNDTLPTENIRIELLDPGGLAIDATPLFSEPDNGFAGATFIGPMGSQMTWQRSPNGANLSLAGKWVFTSASGGMENPSADVDFKMLVWNLLRGAFSATWDSLKDQLALSLDFIVKLVTQFIQRFIDDVLRVVAKSVVESSLFLDVMLTDMTGSAGGGITLSFVIEGGDTLAAILRWVIGSVSAFLAKFGKPTQPAQYPKLAADIPEHLYVRLEFYGMVQVPQMVKSAVQVGADMEPVKLAGRIEANIPALAALVGKDLGRWRINFGVYIEKMPAAIADPLFGTGDATPNVWLFKGAVFEV